MIDVESNTINSTFLLYLISRDMRKARIVSRIFFMKHSHPRTLGLLSKLADKNQVKLTVLKTDNLLKDLCVRIRVNRDSFNNKTIEIDIPFSLDDSSNNVKRIFNCFSFWIPYCLEIYARVIYPFSLCLNASDWEENNFLSMTSEDVNNIIPDEYAMFESRKLEKSSNWNSFEEFYDTWSKRKNIMFWRGSTTGLPITSIQSLSKLKRIKVSLLYQKKDGFDIRISNIVQNRIPKQVIKQWLNKNNIRGRRVVENRFKNFKYYPDMPGNNESCGSWGTVRKHIRGNLIFKPNHKSKMLYDELMTPWKHFIPVDSEFLDLYEKYNWAENNPYESARIAWDGFLVAESYLRNIKDYFIQASLKRIQPLNIAIENC